MTFRPYPLSAPLHRSTVAASYSTRAMANAASGQPRHRVYAGREVDYEGSLAKSKEPTALSSCFHDFSAGEGTVEVFTQSVGSDSGPDLRSVLHTCRLLLQP